LIGLEIRNPGNKANKHEKRSRELPNENWKTENGNLAYDSTELKPFLGYL
jgi:hypothetical protein